MDLAIILVTFVFTLILLGIPVALALGGGSLLFSLVLTGLGLFDSSILYSLPNRLWGIAMNDLLLAIPLFILMGNIMERAKISEDLLEMMARVFGNLRGGIAISVMLVGVLMAASTGIVGATVVTMGLISLPVMQRNNYNNSIACGTICAAGTLGQIIPPSIALILLGDQISSSYQSVQMELGLASNPVSVADLFAGAIIPALLLVTFYIGWIIIYGFISPKAMPVAQFKNKFKFSDILIAAIAPLTLIFIVLGSILSGIATATESAAIGVFGALFLAIIRNRLSHKSIDNILESSALTSCMIYSILIGATIFTLVFRGLEGDLLIENLISDLPGGLFTALLIVMLVIFILGFFLDFIEIIFVLVPITAPALLQMGADPVWLAIIIALNLQTSFLTPPFGFALFYLKGVVKDTISTIEIYKGVIPFIIIQLIVLAIVICFPTLATWLPEELYNTPESNFTIDETGELSNENGQIYVEPDVVIEEDMDF